MSAVQEFTGREYLQIDIANQYGLDKCTWDERLDWFQQRTSSLEQHIDDAEHPVLYRKAVKAWREHEQGKAVTHTMGLDATASGLQVYAAITGCRRTAEAVNVVSTGRREDVYTHMTDSMNQQGASVTRSLLKNRS